MNAFVAGATGYTGREVVRKLVRRGADVVAHIRPDSDKLAEWRARFEHEGARVESCKWQLDALEDAFLRHNPTHIFALLGTTRSRVRDAARDGREESYDSVDYGLTAMLVNAARTCAPAARFIYLSSLGVSGATRVPYLKARWQLESELKESGLRYTIARPAFVTGADREEFRLGERVLATVTKAALGVAGALGLKRLRERFATLSGKQLAQALVNAAFDDDCLDRTLDVPRLHALARH